LVNNVPRGATVVVIWQGVVVVLVVVRRHGVGDVATLVVVVVPFVIVGVYT
jgi:hypothetical protein